MLTLTKGSDGATLPSLNLLVERGTDTSPKISVRITNTGLADYEGGFLALFVEKTPGDLDWVTTGHPAVDELWGRFQLTGIGGANPGQEMVPDGEQPMGHLAVARLPKIIGGDWVVGDFWLRQPQLSAGGSTINCRLLVGGDSPARGVPLGVASVARGVVSGVNMRRSFLINGSAVTATLVNDAMVHVGAGEWLLDGFEYASNAIEDVTLNQDDGSAVTLASGESYWAAITRGASGTVTVTKGDLDAATPTKPELPVGELFVAFVLVLFGGGGSVIAPGDIDQDVSYGRLLSEPPNTGLSTVIHPGESLTGGFSQWHATKETVILAASSSNWVWMQYGGALAVTQTPDAPSAVAIPLWLHVTDGAGVTATTDLRPFIGQAFASGRFGGGVTERMLEEVITLDTGAAFTDSVADLLPANGRILGVAGIVTADITGPPTQLEVGDAGAAPRFVPVGTGLTAGSQFVGLDHVGTINERQSAAGQVRITLDGIPTAGAVRVQVRALVFTAPTA